MGQFGNRPAIRGVFLVKLTPDQKMGFEFMISVLAILILFHVELCLQCLASNNREYVDLSAIALELQKLYRQVHQNRDLILLKLKQRW